MLHISDKIYQPGSGYTAALEEMRKDFGYMEGAKKRQATTISGQTETNTRVVICEIEADNQKKHTERIRVLSTQVERTPSTKDVCMHLFSLTSQP
jgi:cysteine sulfinate desulfinase/cysteine desulfurase-like protein